jgi:hypothetical protein
MTMWVIVSICIQGIDKFDFDSRAYKAYLWYSNGALLPLCFGFLCYGLLLRRNVSGALSRPAWDPETESLNAVKANVSKKIVLVVSISTVFWLMRLIMILIWQLQTHYEIRGMKLIDFSGKFV